MGLLRRRDPHQYGIAQRLAEGRGPHALNDKGILTGIVPEGKEKPISGRLTTDTEAIDSLSFHIAMVVVTYFLSFLLLKGVSFLLAFLGKTGNELATNLWGINFIFSSLTAILVRKVMDALHLGRLLDDDTLNRISGFSVDYMLAGAIAAISLAFVGQYWFPIILMSTLCGLMVFYTVPWMSSRMFKDYKFERMLMLYGVSTGTLSTGLALLRVMDPEFKSKVASDYMVSAGLTFALAVPFILSINLPAKAYQTGDMSYYWMMIGVAGAYLLYVLGSYVFLARKKSFAKPGQFWYTE
ncbi:MAG: hypothetical protein WBH97_05495 [Rectinemataceae bacterium]